MTTQVRAKQHITTVWTDVPGMVPQPLVATAVEAWFEADGQRDFNVTGWGGTLDAAVASLYEKDDANGRVRTP